MFVRDSGRIQKASRTMPMALRWSLRDAMLEVLVGIPAGFRRLLLALLELGVAVSKKCDPAHFVFELPAFLHLTNTDPFAACFVVIGNATPGGIRVVRSVLGAIRLVGLFQWCATIETSNG